MKLGNTYLVKKVEHVHDIRTSVPGSKSITNRALLLAALAEGTSVLKGVLFSDDSRKFIQALIDLNFPVVVDEEHHMVTITGFGGRIPKSNDGSIGKVNVGSAGTAARFLTAFLGLSEGRYYMTSSEQMKKRPMKELLEALESLGAALSFQEEPYHFPFEIGNKGMKCFETVIDIDKSSQFLSALLITSVLFQHDFRIRVTGHHGMAYVKMTIAMMKQFGVEVKELEEQCYLISGTASYSARDYVIEPDLSAACYFYGMCPLLQVPVLVNEVHQKCLQGDIQFLHVLRDMGCSIVEKKEGILLLPPSQGLNGGEWNFSAFSDQALTMAAIAPFAKNSVTIKNISHIRLQECDRMNAISSNLEAVGITCECTNDSIRITPGNPHGAFIHTFDDHRVAMAFSLVGLMVDDVVIENPACCRKTFENYFEVLEASVYS